MQIGIRLHDTKELPIEERLALVHEMGFRCVHMALQKALPPDFPCTNEAMTPGLAMYLRRQLEKNELDCAVLGCYLNLATPNPKQLAETTRRYMTHIRFASWLGAGVVGTETGAPNETYTFVPESHGEEALRTFITNLRPVVDYAEKMGVVVAIEPVWRHIVYDAKRARRVLDEINSPNLQIILDAVNLLHPGNCRDHAAVIQEAIDLLGEEIAVLHLKDFKLVDGEVRETGAGLGEMDYTPLIRFMKERKPFIHATLEASKPEENVWCREFVEKLYR